MSGCIGWDVGGAHLKAVRINVGGECVAAIQHACPLWRGIGELKQAWCAVGTALGEAEHHAVTMTGEMADCFSDRSSGVEMILETAANMLKRPFWVYSGARGLIADHDARCSFAEVAAANWHVAASCAAGFVRQGIFMDVGSTTTDIVPFAEGRVSATAATDSSRLASGELVYTGVVRTPVMAMTQTVEVGGLHLPIVAEQFANAADVYRLLGRLPPGADQYPTCDGQAKTRSASARRLARMLGRDYDGDIEFWVSVAHCLAKMQMEKISSAYLRVARRSGDDLILVGAGIGRFVIKQIAVDYGLHYYDFTELLNCRNVACDMAPALGLARVLHDKIRVRGK